MKTCTSLSSNNFLVGTTVLNSIAEVSKKIVSGKALLLAGSEAALSQLPKGNWIGGTTSYFIDADGGTFSESSIYVDEIPGFAQGFKIAEYSTETLPSICNDAPEKGFTVLILPAGSAVHTAFAENAPRYEGFVLKPIVGWVSGVPLPEVGRTEPKVFNGQTGEKFVSRAVAMHVNLPADKIADIEIVNVFKPGTGDKITFPQSGFVQEQCLVNGKPVNFAHYLANSGADIRLPLTANYNGSVINVSIQSAEESAGVVRLYAPVFAGVEYTFAAPVNDYVKAFESALPEKKNEAVFACNCILNYMYANLGGRSAGTVPSMVTFGEIAHQLLNQTLVRLMIHNC
jgi:Family of unknown function (DUF6976)